MTDEESELEKRAVEELLRETDRARVRAETMGPAGWLKCPLRGTNKRFLLNTLRSTGLQREPSESKEGHSSHATTWESSCRRSRSRSPHDGRDSGHSRKRHRGNISSGDPKRMDRDREREMSHGRKGERDKTADRRTAEKDRRMAEKDRRTTKTRTGSAN